MATIKSYTDIEQSRKLAEILPLESADMYWFRQIDSDYFPPNVESIYPTPLFKDGKEDFNYDTPCWSLAALLNVLPNNEHIATSTSRGSWKIDPIEYLPNIWWCEYEDTKNQTEFNISADNLIDACVAMIEKLHELNLL